jgi:UDP-glucose 4-epimerase
MPRILITGITGFLGSHIAEKLIEAGFSIIGLKRPSSDAWRCDSYSHKIHWVVIDENKSFQTELSNLSIESIIHCAWIGVEASERDDWTLQANNIQFLIDLLEVARMGNISKFLCLGSQAEYGVLSEQVNEAHEVNPLTSYGSTKLACLQIFKSYCTSHAINWIWLRVFTIFGERESHNWLIPSLIRSMETTSQMNLTLGEQQYAYLYVKDFAQIVVSLSKLNIESGIYNVSAEEVLSIKYLIQQIRDKINPSFNLNFGALEYRKNQSMYIAGNTSKLSSQIGKPNYTDFVLALNNTISYYQKK